MLVPLIDPELEVLARQRERFFSEGIMIVVSPLKTVEISFDKYLTYKFGIENNIPVPKTIIDIAEAEQMLEDGELSWPVMVKPRKGSASAHIYKCGNMLELCAAFETAPMPMIQEFMHGDEYGYDIFADKDYLPVSVFCKRKISMRAGETDKAVSVNDPEFIELGKKIVESLEIFGPLDADVMISSEGPKLLELNPRFGGGYPCSHLCGADFPRKLVNMRRDIELTPDLESQTSGTLMFKQDEIISSSVEKANAIHSHKKIAPSRPLNLLFTSVGRRVSLLKQFRRAANELGMPLHLHAADCQAMAPGMQLADKTFLAPKIGSSDYLSELIDYCDKNKIDALIPLLDPELSIFAKSRNEFSQIGTHVVVSSENAVKVSIDKIMTQNFLIKNGFKTPHIYAQEELESAKFPLFMKPRDGSSSAEATKINTPQDLAYYKELRPESIVQDFIEGVEYTVDVFTDFNGKPRCAVPRLRHEVRGGEVSKGQAVKNKFIIQECFRLVEALEGCQGMITVQCFLTPEDDIVFIEINPRFGGGVSLSIQAGADSPRWLLELIAGREPSISMNSWQENLYMLRYDQGIFVTPEEIPE